MVRGLRAFLDSPFYLALVVLLMVAANIFSLELYVFYAYLFLGLVLVLFADDLRGIIPVALCCYMSISIENNPAMNIEGSAFYQPVFIVQVTYIIVISAVLLVGRLISMLICGEKKKLPRLTIGFAALGVSLILGGLLSGFYSFRTAFFGFAVIASLCVLYFLFYYTVNWKTLSKEYWAQLFLAIGLGVLLELLGIYCKAGIFTNGVPNRGVIITGWGMYNNVGCVIAMCLPAPLYLALVKKHGWVFTLLAFLMVLGLVFTQSRGSILFGGALFLVGLVLLLVYAKGKARVPHLIVIAVFTCLAIAVIVAVFAVEAWRGKLFKFFGDMFEKGASDNGRLPIYKSGIEHFKSAPFFGAGFYEVDYDVIFRWGDLSENAFLPPRYHNTIVQLLASGGIFAMLCYVVHRTETLILLFRKPSKEKTFIFLGIAALLLTSLVECHFFSFGPGMLYSVLLVLAEGTGRITKRE